MFGIGFQCLQFQPFFMQPVQIRSGRAGTEAFEDLLYGRVSLASTSRISGTEPFRLCCLYSSGSMSSSCRYSS